MPYNKEEFEQNEQIKKDKAFAVDGLFNSSGWAIYQEIKNNKIKELLDIRNCPKNIKSMEGRIEAIKILEAIDAELQDHINQVK
jgi:hypothetical protein